MNQKVINLVGVNVIVYSFLYLMLYKSNNNNFSGATCGEELFYFAIVCHSTTGFVDILPKTLMAKFIVGLHLASVIIFSLLTIFDHVYLFFSCSRTGTPDR